MKKILAGGILLLCLFLIGCSTTGTSSTNTMLASTSQTGTALPTVTNSPTVTHPTQTPTQKPIKSNAGGATPQPTIVKPAPTAKPTPIPKPVITHPCSVASCPNPWGFFLQVGVDNAYGVIVIGAPSGFCNYFVCGHYFFDRANPGNIIECADNVFQWNDAGCNADGGTIGALMQPYPKKTPTPSPSGPTPTPTPAPTATPAS